MPLNLIKTYNSLLELDAFDEEERNASLMGIFKRDFVDSGNYFRQKKVLPTLSQGKNTLSIFFNHLVAQIIREVFNVFYQNIFIFVFIVIV